MQSVWYQSVTWNSASFVVPCSVAGTSPPATKAAVRVPPSQLWHLWSTTASLMPGKDWDAEIVAAHLRPSKGKLDAKPLSEPQSPPLSCACQLSSAQFQTALQDDI